MGRLFDAVAFWCGFDGAAGCEGHAAMMLESWAAEASGEKMPGDAYEWVMHEEEGLLELDWRPLMKSVDEDLLEGVSRGCIARKFHESLVNLVFDVAERFCLDRLVLGGGCFQNAFCLKDWREWPSLEGASWLCPSGCRAMTGEFPWGRLRRSYANGKDRICVWPFPERL